MKKFIAATILALSLVGISAVVYTTVPFNFSAIEKSTSISHLIVSDNLLADVEIYDWDTTSFSATYTIVSTDILDGINVYMGDTTPLDFPIMIQ